MTSVSKASKDLLSAQRDVKSLSDAMIRGVPSLTDSSMLHTIEVVDQWHKLWDNGKVISAIKHMFFNLKTIFYFYFKGGIVRDLYQNLLKVEQHAKNPYHSPYLKVLNEFIQRIAFSYHGKGSEKDLVETQHFLGIFFRLEGDKDGFNGLGQTRDGHLDVREVIIQKLDQKLKYYDTSYQERVDKIYAQKYSKEIGLFIIRRLEKQKSPAISYLPRTLFPKARQAVKDESSKIIFNEGFRASMCMDQKEFIDNVNQEIQGKLPQSLQDFAIKTEQELFKGLSADDVYSSKIAPRMKTGKIKRLIFGIDLEGIKDPFKDNLAKLSENYANVYHLYLEDLKEKHNDGSLQMPEEVLSPDKLNAFIVSLIKRRDQRFGGRSSPRIYKEAKKIAKKFLEISESFSRDMERFGYKFFEKPADPQSVPARKFNRRNRRHGVRASAK